MGNLVLVPAKKRRFNPYRMVEWSGYALASAFIIWCMWWTVLNINAEPISPDFPWWWLPVGMIGMVGFMALAMGALIALFYVGHGVYLGFLWLRARARQWNEVSD